MPLVWHCQSTFTHLVGKSGLTRQKSLQSWFLVMPLVATKLIPRHALSRYKPYQTKPNHNKKYQTHTKKAYQNKPHHTMQNQTEPK